MTGSKFLQRVPAGPQRPSPRAQLALRGALRPGARAFGELSALGGEWEDWCDSDIGVARYIGEGVAPVIVQNGVWVDNPKYVKGKNICKMQVPLLHPKTMAGQVARFELASAIPSPAEYSSENLWRVMYTDYRRFFELSMFAQLIPGMLLWVGGGFALVEFDRVRQLGYQLARSRGVPESEQDGFSWNHVWETMLRPAVMDGADFVGKFLTNGPWVAIGLKVLEAESKKQNNPPLMRAIMGGLAKNAGLLSVLVGGPEKIRQPSSIALIGQAVVDGAKTMQQAGADGVLVEGVLTAGKAVMFFGPAVAIILDGVSNTASDPASVLLLALDDVSEKVLGIKLSKLKQMRADIQAAAATPNLDALETFRLISRVLKEIKDAFKGTMFEFMVQFLNDITKPVDDIYNVLTGASATVIQAKATANMVQLPGASTPATSSTLSTKGGTSQVGTSSQAMTGESQRGVTYQASAFEFRAGAVGIDPKVASYMQQQTRPIATKIVSILGFKKPPPTPVGKFATVSNPLTALKPTLPKVGPLPGSTVAPLVTAPPAKTSSNTGIIVAAALAAGGGFMLLKSRKSAPLAGVQRRKRRKTRR